MARLIPVDGSLCAPAGFRAAGVAAGLKPSGNPDVALIVSDRPAAAAAVFTQNRVCAAPVLVSREHLERGGSVRAIAVNAGCANACTGEQGLLDARRTAEVTAQLLGCDRTEVLVASTGVIGRLLPMERLEAGLRVAAAELSPVGAASAARAILTTDTRPKEVAVELEVEGRPVRLGGIAKGSGMIAPDMATLLAFLTTDAALERRQAQRLLAESAGRTFNCLTVDGDTSTNDMLAILANGASGVEIPPGSPSEAAFAEALEHVCTHLVRELAADGEGATKRVEVRIRGARTFAEARRAGLAVANSPLVKTALFGNDPNWGRILCAAGYSGVDCDPDRMRLTVAGVPLVDAGQPLPFDEEAAGRAMDTTELAIELDLGQGEASATVWTCDFSYDYVRINAEYTT